MKAQGADIPSSYLALRDNDLDAAITHWTTAGHVNDRGTLAVPVQTKGRGAGLDLLELSRYVVLNPVRARMVDQPDAWPWSSYRATTGLAKAPAWLDTDWLLVQFGPNRKASTEAYRAFVMEGRSLPGPLSRRCPPWKRAARGG